MILADRRALDHRDRSAYRRGSRSPMGATLPCERGKRARPGHPTSSQSRGAPVEPRSTAMLSKSAQSASDRKKWGKQAVGVGQHRILLALWDHAHGWRAGSGEWFVWPSIGTLANLYGITDDAVRRSLRELTARGWIRPDMSDGRKGWWLHVTPTPEQAQLDLFAAPQPVDNLCTEPANHRAARDGCTPENVATIASLPLGKEGTKVNVAAEHDDDAQRIWLGYEADRVRMLGGTARGGTAPPLLRALIRSHGLAVVETYATRSLALARDAVDRARQCAPALVAARADGREWTIPRLEAVAAFPDPVGPVTRAPPPPEPTAAGERVTLHEREAFDRGGEAAVLAQRRALAERPHAGVAHIDDWLRRMGGGA